MKNFEEDWMEEEFQESPQEAIEKIQLINNAKLILKEMQITKTSHYKKDIKKIAKEYIKNFFKNKKDYKGGKIKKDRLFEKKHLNNILNKNISTAAKEVYFVLEKYKKYHKKTEDVTNDIKIVNETLKKIYKSKIPQQFAGGFLIMYLEICKGVKFEK